jgi:hypothetical protein
MIFEKPYGYDEGEYTTLWKHKENITEIKMCGV